MHAHNVISLTQLLGYLHDLESKYSFLELYWLAFTYRKNTDNKLFGA